MYKITFKKQTEDQPIILNDINELTEYLKTQTDKDNLIIVKTKE